MKAEIGTYPKDRQLLYQILPIDTPLVIDLCVSNICNFKCNYCIHSSSVEEYNRSGLKKEFMSWELFELAVEQIKEFPNKVKQIVLNGIGEPTLNHQLPNMIQAIRKADITNNVMIITNGSMLTPEFSKRLVDAGLQLLRISLQGLSAQKYKEISNTEIKWDEFYRNIVYFSKIKGSCKLKVKIADTALEPGDEEKFYTLFGDICDAVAVEHIYNLFAARGKCDTPSLSLVQSEKNRYGFPMRKIDVCWQPFIRMLLHPDGKTQFCCGTWLGVEQNIKDIPMLEQWNSSSINKLRANFLQHNMMKHPPCQSCTLPFGQYHPEDILDGHEEEILQRMRDRAILED